MINTVLILGYGLIAQKHYRSLKKIKNINRIYIYSRRDIKYKYSINSLKDILLINPQYIIIASETSNHFNLLKFIVNNFKKKIILVEKPIFDKYQKIDLKKNKVFVGYNLRMHPILLFLKQKLRNKKLLSVDIACESYLPNWRKNRNYINTTSAIKKYGGGVLLDLSHELDYTSWLFGSISIQFVKNLKISNLKIDTDDFLILNAINKNKVHISVSLNYFSMIPIRRILVKGEKFTILADILKNKILLINQKQKKKIFFKNTKDLDTYYNLHKNILSNNINNVCSYEEGLKTMKLIEKIRNF